MLLPPGQVLHKDLNTSFTNFEQLILDLRESRFNGYIRVNFWGYEGILIFDVGRIVQAYSSEKDNFVLGEKAVMLIINKASGKDGTIDVHLLSNEMAITMASVFGSIIYNEQDNVGGNVLKKIFQSLETENITGYVDFQFGSKKGLGTVYLLEGTPLEAVIMSNTGRIVSGEVVFQKILELGELIKSSIKIYENKKVEFIQEERVFLLPFIHTTALEFWTLLMRVLQGEINKILKKNDFLKLWQSSKNEISDSYPFMDPISGFLEWKDDSFKIRGVISLSDFYDGMVRSLSVAIQKIPPRRRKKIKMGKILDRFLKDISNLPAKSVTPDPFKTINNIFQEY